MKNDPLAEKSYQFAIKIVKLAQSLMADQREFILSKQVLRSGTSVGAQRSEARFAQSKADFVNKMSIALKEANETEYWLRLLHDTQTINSSTFGDLHGHCNELIAMLVATVRTAKGRK